MTFFSGVHFLTDSQCKFRPNTKGAAAIAQQEADVEEEKAELQRRTNPHAAFGGAGRAPADALYTLGKYGIYRIHFLFPALHCTILMLIV